MNPAGPQTQRLLRYRPLHPPSHKPRLHNSPLIAAAVHERVHTPVVQPVLILHAPDPEGAAEVMHATAAVSPRVSSQLGVPGGGVSLATPLGAGDTEELRGVTL